VGAWIETSKTAPDNSTTNVAPCVGAWIETLQATLTYDTTISRALRGRVD